MSGMLWARYLRWITNRAKTKIRNLDPIDRCTLDCACRGGSARRLKGLTEPQIDAAGQVTYHASGAVRLAWLELNEESEAVNS